MESTKHIDLPIATPSMYPIIDRSNRNHNNFRTQGRPNNSSLNPFTECWEDEQVIEGESKTEHAIQGEQLKEKQKTN